MTSDHIENIRFRALKRTQRTDHPEWCLADLPEPASDAAISDAERELGFELWKDHKRILREIANGGFGPGYGLIGIRGGTPDDEGRTLIELRRQIFEEAELSMAVIPICDWGGGAWACVHCQTGEILTCSEIGMRKLGVSFDEWLHAWAQGKNWWPEMFDFEAVEVVDPSTGNRSVISKLKDSG